MIACNDVRQNEVQVADRTFSAVACHMLASRYTCRTALSLIGPQGQHAAVYAHVQGNLGALLLSADRPAEAIAEFEGALKLGQQLQQQLQQQIKQQRKISKKHKQQQQRASAALLELQQELQGVQQQLAGATFNLGKALTSIGRCGTNKPMVPSVSKCGTASVPCMCVDKQQ
jgi:hypothetical protein